MWDPYVDPETGDVFGPREGVLGDDLILGGVAYDSTVWEHDGEGGVQPRLGPEASRIRANDRNYREIQGDYVAQEGDAYAAILDLELWDAADAETRTATFGSDTTREEMVEQANVGREMLRQIRGWQEWLNAAYESWQPDNSENGRDELYDATEEEPDVRALAERLRDRCGDLIWYDAADDETRAFYWPGLTRTELEEREAAAAERLQRHRLRNNSANATAAAVDRARDILNRRDRRSRRPAEPERPRPAATDDGPAF